MHFCISPHPLTLPALPPFHHRLQVQTYASGNSSDFNQPNKFFTIPILTMSVKSSLSIRWIIFFVPACILLLQTACHLSKNKNTSSNMKFNSDYAALWMKVDTFEQQGLPKSALTQTEEIAAIAHRENNTEQILKSTIFRGKFISQLEEDGLIKAIQLFENEAKTSGQPGKAILQSMLGELYATYLSNEGWVISNRTPVSDEGGDVLTWSAAQIEKRSIDCYKNSLTPQDVLSATPVTSMKELITAGQLDSLEGVALRPTLLDLLGHRAATHFANDRSFLSEPVNAFRLDHEAAFALPETFVNTSFNTQDSLSGKWRALKTYQLLTLFHQGKGARNPALLDVTLLRLQFAKNSTARPDGSKLYLQALDQLHEQYKGSEEDADIQYQRAQEIYQNSFGASSTAANPLLTVAEICESTIKAYPGSLGARQCAGLLYSVRIPLANCNIEAVQVSEKPILLSINYKNISKVWYKIIKFDPKTNDGFEYLSYDQLITQVENPAVMSGELTLTDPGDLKEHRTEASIAPLPTGAYIIVLYKNANKSSDQITDFAPFRSSTMGVVDVSASNETKVYMVTNRLTGQPLAGIAGEIVQRTWGGNGNILTVQDNVITNQQGTVTISTKKYTNAFVRFKQGDDTAETGEFYNFDNGEQQTPATVNFFTDRGLYRPGQTVYFKTVAFQLDKNNRPAILANAKMTVQVFNVNDQQIQDIPLTTNEFGTANGSFALPSGGLTGGFRMVANMPEGNGYTYFNVEEYKRPKFEVTFQPLEGSYKLNDQVTVTGKAAYYAGNPADGAMVKYRVTRVAYFPYRYSKMIWPSPINTDQEVAFGESTSDKDGTFRFTFTTLPDDTPYPAGSEPVFRYEVSADVTDAAGETRTGNTTVVASFKSILADVGLEEETTPDSLKHISVSTTNVAQQKVAAKGIITLQRLDAPDKAFIDRIFPEPDIWSIPETEFRQQFPRFSYKGENDPKNWKPVGAQITYNFDTGKESFLNMAQPAPAPGYYKVKMTARDEKGNEGILEKIIRIKKSAADLLQPGVITGNILLEPGQKSQYTFASPYPNMYVYFTEIHQNDRVSRSWENISGSKGFQVQAEESDRGDFYTYWTTIYENRVYTGSIRWEVPFSNKKLDIRFETFRDKLAPGQSEEYRLRISGPGKEKVAAELVASMYDASLDQFSPFGWGFSPYQQFYPSGDHIAYSFNQFAGNNYIPDYSPTPEIPSRVYPAINWFNFPMYSGRMMYAMDVAAPAGGEILEKSRSSVQFTPPVVKADMEVADEVLTFDPGDNGAPPPPPPAPGAFPSPLRSNLNETVFFFPELRTDANGDVLVKFKMNEALTRWKLQVLAHTKDLKYALTEKSVVTQKDLMITANAPRFLRAGDEIVFSATVSNLTENTATGTASLALLDAATLQPVEKQFALTDRVETFEIPAKQSGPVFWKIKVPADYTGAVTWQVFAESKGNRDGEESTIPVVTNRILVTETLPLALRGNTEKTFQFEPWKNSATRTPVRYSLEFTSNPVWYAVQSLPYLMEYPHECSEQVFSRFYANTLASSVTTKMPAIRRVYDRWKGTPAMLSNLSKNQELKSAILEETPWVSDAQDEEKQKQQIALLFDLNKMADERRHALGILSERQSANGGWPWFPGGRESWSITQHIVCGMLHLERLDALDLKNDQESLNMLDNAMGFCQNSAQEQYNEIEKLVKQGKTKWDDDHLDPIVIQYLYGRSFYPMDKPDKVFSYFTNLIGKHWKSKGLYEQGLLALIANRTGQRDVAQMIVRSLKERALIKDELGMYWPNDWGMYWYQLPIETQAIMVEVFNEVANDRTAVDNLRIWLLKNKQTNRWESTKATAEAIYALLLTGDNWLEDTKPVSVKIDGKAVSQKEYEPGTGYFKQQIEAGEVKTPWTSVVVNNPNATIVWGAAYRQYFDDLDQVTGFKKTGLTIERKIYVQKNTESGPALTLIKDGDVIKVGDQMKVRIEIRCDRPMEFVHLKDMRPSGCEPRNVLSGYRYQGGLGYYESTRDLATHFFIDYLPRGTYVMEYPLAATHKGEMSFGISSLQCMYAPEFASHSAGIRIKID